MATRRLLSSKRLGLTLLLIAFVLIWRSGWMNFETKKPEGPDMDPKTALPRQAKIGKVTVVLNKLNTSFISRSLQSHRKQNELHGYPHFVGNHSLVAEPPAPKDRPSGTWTKPAYLINIILQELNKEESDRLEWVFWFDADTIILNPHIRLETFLPPKSLPSSAGYDAASIHMLLTSNWDGINAGVFPIRVHPWSVALLSAMLAYPYFKPSQPLEFQDQSALAYTLDSVDAFAQNFTIVPHRWFNSFPINAAFNEDGKWVYAEPMTPEQFDDGEEYVSGKVMEPWKVLKGDMCLHFAGAKVRDSWMNPWADRAEMYLPEWSNSIYQSRLEEEAAHFWGTLEPQRRRGEAREQKKKDRKQPEKQPQDLLHPEDVVEQATAAQAQPPHIHYHEYVWHN